MPTYEVTVSRTEMIAFQITAESPLDAENRCLSDGKETGSKTTDCSVVSVVGIDDAPPRAAPGPSTA